MVEQHGTRLLVESVVREIIQLENDNFKTASLGSFSTEDEQVLALVAANAETWQFKTQLTADETQRLVGLNEALRQLLRKQTPSTERIKTLLTYDEHSAYEQSLTESAHISEVLYADGVPDELRRYNQMLRDADFQYHKFERMSSLRRIGIAKYKQDSITRTINAADKLYERAIEYLVEQINAPANRHRRDELLRWLDRDFEYSIDGNISLVPDEMPRVKGSRSGYAQDAALPKLSPRLKRRQRMLEHLLRAAVSCAFEPEETPTQVAAPKLRKMPNLNPERD